MLSLSARYLSVAASLTVHHTAILVHTSFETSKPSPTAGVAMLTTPRTSTTPTSPTSPRRRATAALTATLLALTATLGITLAAPAHATEKPATGSFTFTTGPGVLAAWESAGIFIVGVSPGSVLTNPATKTARVSLPVVAKAGTANATAGGFRFLNTTTGASVRCSVPTVDTRARVVDCVLPTGYNSALFEITTIENRSRVDTDTRLTTIFQGMQLRIINREMANRMNDELSTSVFSASVVVGNGSLLVSRSRS